MSLYSSTLNRTITCALDGSDYIISSSRTGAFTCDSLLHDTAASLSSNDRSVTSIVWSCLATVFACTWVSVHPNIPHPHATDWQIRRHRFLTMVCGLIAPELIVLWALRQWIGARFLVRKMRAKGVKKFTVVHGHFMQMGGFMLYSKGMPLRVIKDYNELASCILESKYILPTAEQIRDRSKGDALSKALVVGQTGWFVAQCISRWVLGLAITEIELVTVAFAALNGVIYFLWWNKPLDVRFAVDVQRHIQEDEDTDTYASQNTRFTATTISKESFNDSGWKVRVGDDLQMIRQLVARSRIGRLIPVLKSYIREENIPDEEEPMASSLRISTLHSSCDPEDTYAATTLASGVGILFGAVHCIAWDFHFLTQRERLVWRIWSVIITAAPFILFMKSAVSYIFIRRLSSASNFEAYHVRVGSRISRALLAIISQIGRPSIWLTVLLAPIYMVARLGLLAQALAALRDLQPSERAEVQWVNFLPHL